MTLVSIITQALVTLGRSTDAQSMEAWKEKLTIFANDGAKDLAEYLKLRKTETITAEDNQIDVDKLSAICVKVVSVKRNGSDLDFTMGSDTRHINIGQSGDVEVEYRYLPKEMENDIDTPGIPEHLHHLLVPYIVFREHQTADPTMQRRSDSFWQTYNFGKNEARRNLGELDTYKFYNTGWF